MTLIGNELVSLPSQKSNYYGGIISYVLPDKVTSAEVASAACDDRGALYLPSLLRAQLGTHAVMLKPKFLYFPKQT